MDIINCAASHHRGQRQSNEQHWWDDRPAAVDRQPPRGEVQAQRQEGNWQQPQAASHSPPADLLYCLNMSVPLHLRLLKLLLVAIRTAMY